MSTGFIGYLLINDNNAHQVLSKLRKYLVNQYGNDFKPQQYLHTTLIYLSNSYIEDTNKLLFDTYFCEKIKKFKNSVCIFKKIHFIGNCLVLVFKFKERNLNIILKDLINKYERNYHSRYFHITLGSFNTIHSKKKFLDSKDFIIDNFLHEFSFTIDKPVTIKVDKDKSYHVYKSLL